MNRLNHAKQLRHLRNQRLMARVILVQTEPGNGDWVKQGRDAYRRMILGSDAPIDEIRFLRETGEVGLAIKNTGEVIIYD